MSGVLKVWGRNVTPGVLYGSMFLLAFALRASLALAIDAPHQLLRYEPGRIAVSLAEHGRYANPFPTPTGPTAHIPPAYPLLLALIFKLFGTGVAGEIVKQIMTWVVTSLRAPLIAMLAVRLGLGTRAAVIGGGVGAGWIGSLETEIRGEFGSPWEALLLMALVWMAYRRPLADKWTTRAALLYGALWGATVLFNPVVLLIFGAFAVLGIAKASGRGRLRAVAQIGIMAGVLILTLVPWAVRNRMALGSWIWTRSNLGLELWCSYHPGARWNLLVDLDPQTKMNPTKNPTEAAEAQQLGEAAYNAKKLKQALAFIRSQPAESVRLLGMRAVLFWFPWRRNALHKTLSGLFTVFAWVGAALLNRQNKRFARLAWAVLLVFPSVYYVQLWSSRYRLPIEWLLVLLVGLTLARISQRIWPVPEKALGAESTV